MVLKWIPATSAEVEIIGDACLLSGCTLLSLAGKLCRCVAGLSRGHILLPLLSLQSRLNATAKHLWP